MNEEIIKKIEEIMKHYNIRGKCVDIEENHTGNINSTYVISMQDDNKIKRYIVQRINTNAFKRPDLLMHNIESVTNHIENVLSSINDVHHQTLHVVKTKENESYCYILLDEDKEYYRVYNYIENSKSYDIVNNREIAYKVGQAFGNFQSLLREFPIMELAETIPDFHNTPKRFAQLEEDIFNGLKKRIPEIGQEFYTIYLNKKCYGKITEALNNQTIPWRVTHNDTKVNNVMMDQTTDEFLAVIDLDTVMPGSLLYDYGDGIRSTAATATENETDLKKVGLNLELFEAYTDGFLSEMAPYIYDSEVELLGESIKIITLELAIRFLDDYICGDMYFKVDPQRKKHNLERARNQLALVKDIEKKMPDIEKYIKECYKKYKGKIKKIV